MARKIKDDVDDWFNKSWRPAMALLYFFLCVLDYGIRPLTNIIESKKFDLVKTVEIIHELPAATQVQLLQLSKDKEPWPPILNEFVHVAFGAILGVAAYTRGTEKIERIKRGYPSNNSNNINVNDILINSRINRRKFDNVDNPDDE